MGKYERGFDDVADLAGTGGDVMQGAPASGQDGESSLAQTTQSAEQGIVGTGVDIENLPVGRLFDRGEHANTGAVVASIGQRGQPGCGCRVQRAEHVLASAGQVMQ